MSVSYKKLWKLLIDKDMKKKDLCEKAGISPASVTKMGRNGHVTTEILMKICAALDCDIEDKILVDKNIIALPNWEALEQIFSLRNDFAHNPIHLRNGKLVLTKNGQDVLYGESDIATIRDRLTLVEGELIAQAPRQDEDSMTVIDAKKELCAV